MLCPLYVPCPDDDYYDYDYMITMITQFSSGEELSNSSFWDRTGFAAKMVLGPSSPDSAQADI